MSLRMLPGQAWLGWGVKGETTTVCFCFNIVYSWLTYLLGGKSTQRKRSRAFIHTRKSVAVTVESLRLQHEGWRLVHCLHTGPNPLESNPRTRLEAIFFHSAGSDLVWNNPVGTLQFLLCSTRVFKVCQFRVGVRVQSSFGRNGQRCVLANLTN